MGIHSAYDDEKAWLYTSSQHRQRCCSCSLSREYLLHRVLFRGQGPLLLGTPVPLELCRLLRHCSSSSGPVSTPSTLLLLLMTCVDSFDTAPPPHELCRVVRHCSSSSGVRGLSCFLSIQAHDSLVTNLIGTKLVMHAQGKVTFEKEAITVQDKDRCVIGMPTSGDSYPAVAHDDMG